MAKGLSAAKAKKILQDGYVKGKPLTAKQKKYFGAIASGGTPLKAMNGNWLDKFAMGGSLPGASGMMYSRNSGSSAMSPPNLTKAQDGTVEYGTPEYKKAYEEGTFADVPNQLDEVVMYSGVDYDKYPYYNDLSAEQRKYFKDDGPIGRGVRRAAYTKKGLAEDTYDVVNPIMYGMLGVAGGMMAGPSIATLGRAAAVPIGRALSYKPFGGPVSIGNTIDAVSAAYAAYNTPEAYDKFKENPSFDTGLDLGLTAMDMIPFSEIFTGGKNIKNLYNKGKNLFTNDLKPNPNMYYRGIGQSGLDDITESGLLRAKPADQIPFNGMGSKFDFAKRFNNLYVTPRFNVADQYGRGVVAEIPKDIADFSQRYKSSDWSMMTNNQIPIEEVNLYKKNFFGNYKPVNIPQPSLSSMPFSKPNIYPTSSPLPKYMEPYLSRRVYPFNKEQEVFESFLSTDRRLNNIDSKSLYYNQAGKRITKGEADNLLYPPEYQKNGGDVDKAQYGRLLKWGKDIYDGIRGVDNVVDVANTVRKTSKVVDNAWTVKPLPGLHLKSTMDNGAISKIIESKTGLINTEQALAIINKESGGAEKVALIRQQLGDNIPKKMDYNNFRTKTQESLIPLEVKINYDGNSEYGLENIGYDPWKIEHEALTISNRNQFGTGSSMHGNPDDTLGHVHFLKDADNPNTLTITQIQSDAFQGGKSTKETKEQLQKSLSLNKKHAEAQRKLHDLAVQDPNSRVWTYPDGQQLSNSMYNKVMDGQNNWNKMQQASIDNYSQKQLLGKNHEERYLQEIVNYAGANGNNKIRIPTMETAAKVQGFNDMQQNMGVLKKYKNQPKTIKKLYGQDVITVTDSKGNTWYEFDIPESFKSGKGEIKAFKEGGSTPKAQVGDSDVEKAQWGKLLKLAKKYGNKVYEMYKGTDEVVDAASTTGKLKYMDELSSKAKKDVYEQNYEALTKTDKETRNLGKPHIAQEEYGEGWKYSDQVDFNNPEEVAAHRKRWIASQKKGNLINDNRRFPFFDETSDIFSDLSRKDLSGSIRDGLSKQFGTIGNTYRTGYGHRGLAYQTNYLNDYFKNYRVTLPDGSNVPYGKLDGSVEIDPSSFNSSDEVMEELRRLAQTRMGDQFNNAFEKTSRIDFGDLLKNKNRNGGWLSKYENGGVIEDDRGQWAHPGEVTKINSNNITMKGVNYPVLGISDTGDTKMMQPGVENYTYDGSSVTEYPMAQDGLKTKVPDPTPQINFMKDWASSAMHNKMLDASSSSDKFKNKVKGARTNFDDVTIGMFDDPGYLGLYSNSNIRMNPSLLEEAPIGNGYNSILTHELSHYTDDVNPSSSYFKGYNIPLSDQKLIKDYSKKGIKRAKAEEKELNKLLKSENMKPNSKDVIKERVKRLKYLGNPTETRSRINATRYFYENDKNFGRSSERNAEKNLPSIFDSEVTPDMIKVMQESGQYKQLQELYTDDQILEMFNTISDNSKSSDPSNMAYAKEGESLVALDQLTNFTNYNTPQPGGWLDKY